jgi:hypothetical protein
MDIWKLDRISLIKEHSKLDKNLSSFQKYPVSDVPYSDIHCTLKCLIFEVFLTFWN